jgi:hypothetical protein
MSDLPMVVRTVIGIFAPLLGSHSNGAKHVDPWYGSQVVQGLWRKTIVTVPGYRG